MSNSCDPMDYNPPGSSVHGILQTRILEQVVIPFSRASSWPRDRTQVSCNADKFFTFWATGKPPPGLKTVAAPKAVCPSLGPQCLAHLPNAIRPSLPSSGQLWGPLSASELPLRLVQAFYWNWITAWLLPRPRPASVPSLSQVLIPQALPNEYPMCQPPSQHLRHREQTSHTYQQYSLEPRANC